MDRGEAERLVGELEAAVLTCERRVGPDWAAPKIAAREALIAALTAPDPAIRAAREEVLAKCVSFLDYGVERAHRDWRDPRQAEAVAEVCAEIAGAMRALPLDPEQTP